MSSCDVLQVGVPDWAAWQGSRLPAAGQLHSTRGSEQHGGPATAAGRNQEHADCYAGLTGLRIATGPLLLRNNNICYCRSVWKSKVVASLKTTCSVLIGAALAVQLPNKTSKSGFHEQEEISHLRHICAKWNTFVRKLFGNTNWKFVLQLYL